MWLPPAVVAASTETHPVADTPTPELRSLRVLVVDDNEDAAEMMTAMLAQWGYDARPAADGHAALAAAEIFSPEVVLLDLGLPDIDGYDVAQRLRARPWASATRIYAVTGRGQERDRRRSMASGLDDHLVKPIDPDALRQRLSRVGA